jgi:hypothetical protein
MKMLCNYLVNDDPSYLLEYFNYIPLPPFPFPVTIFNKPSILVAFYSHYNAITLSNYLYHTLAKRYNLVIADELDRGIFHDNIDWWCFKTLHSVSAPEEFEHFRRL